MIEQINSWFLLASGIATGIAGFYAWITLRKEVTKRDISEARKLTKVQDVEGDEAIVRQIDLLLNQISLMSENMLKDKIDLSNTKVKEIRYKEAIERIKNSCNDCKFNIEKVLTDLNLH
jgi:hypothetical protein